ncbi:hypothetical protein ABZV52_30095 [Streptomyces sp. NPDC004735]|uniref:hypothetical protein n=1 Tax=Streptomyces sp. NPDC004735 TaxID=3156654 RepID=UPI0033B5BE87
MLKASATVPLTATIRADFMALQVLIFARLHNAGVVTVDLVDAVMSRDAGTEQGKANPVTVRRIIRKRAAAEGVRVIFTSEERYWAIREQLHCMAPADVDALRDSIADGGEEDPRAWDTVLIDALSAYKSGRVIPARLWDCKPVSVRLWREPVNLPEADDSEELYKALMSSLCAADLSDVTFCVTASQDGVERDCPPQEGKRMVLAVGIKHGDGARVEGTAEAFTVDWRGVKKGPGDIVFTFRRTATTAEVLAADPIPAGTSVLSAMPGRWIEREELREARSSLAHEAYVVQLRTGGAWVLPNHDDPAELSRRDVFGVLRRFLNTPWARASLDADGTVYLSDGFQGARYIPTERLSGFQTGVCPGCGTPYAENGDGPCPAEAHPA